MDINPKKNRRGKRSFKRLLPLFITTAILTVILVFQLIIRKNEAVAEWVSLNISSRIASGMGHISSLIPFFIFEWLVILFFLCLATLLILGVIALIKRHFRGFVKGLTVSVMVFVALLNVYNLSAGYMYYRKPVAILKSDTVYKGADAEDVAAFFIARLNALADGQQRDEDGYVISPYSPGELTELLQDEYKRLDNGYFFEYTPRFKLITNSWFMSSTDYAGVTFLPLGEAGVNRLMPITNIVFTAAHELAHAKGVMREYEANMTAYYILITSSDSFLQYCGYLNYLYDLPRIPYMGNNLDTDIRKHHLDSISPSVFNDYDYVSSYWSNYVGPLDKLGKWFTGIGDWFNNLYLRSNGAENGTGSYVNNWDVIDTGETDPETNKPIYEPVYSNIHRILFYIYEQGL